MLAKRYYEESLFITEEFYKAEIALFAKYLPPAPGTILEMGCATGRLLRLFSDMGHRSIGLDNDPDMLSLADAKLRPIDKNLVSLVYGDMSKENSYRNLDAIVCWTNTLSLLLDQDDLQAFFMNSYSMLKKGGRLLIWTVNDNSHAMIRPVRKIRTLEGEIELHSVMSENWQEKTRLLENQMRLGSQSSFQNWMTRILSIKDIHELYRETHFNLQALHGDLKGGEYDEKSPFQIHILEK